jgi:hypothetical protein
MTDSTTAKETLLHDARMEEKGFLGFSARELKVIAWPTNGIKGSEITQRLGCSWQGAYNLLKQAMSKAGEPEDAEIKPPKVYKRWIRLGRIRRTRTND